MMAHIFAATTVAMIMISGSLALHYGFISSRESMVFGILIWLIYVAMLTRIKLSDLERKLK